MAEYEKLQCAICFVRIASIVFFLFVNSCSSVCHATFTVNYCVRVHVYHVPWRYGAYYVPWFIATEPSLSAHDCNNLVDCHGCSKTCYYNSGLQLHDRTRINRLYRPSLSGGLPVQTRIDHRKHVSGLQHTVWTSIQSDDKKWPGNQALTRLAH